MRPASPFALLLLLAFVASAGGCSSKPDAHMWAAQVCRALTPWRSEIGALATRTQQQMNAKTTPAQAKENLMSLFGGARDASERARAGVARAGVPDVTNGSQVASSFLTSLSAVRDAYGRAQAGIAALATAPAKAFYEQVTKVVDQLNADYSAGSLDTSKLNSPELKTAFDDVPECR